jgi:TP53 regulating kinase-like protein
MVKAKKIGINVPYLMNIDYESKKIYMQYIDNSLKLRDFLNEFAKNVEKPVIFEMMGLVGSLIAKLHDADIIHGDLTTSNLMIKSEDYSNMKKIDDYAIYVIDFGLSYQKNTVEDKAVDLYVLERAFLSSHPNQESEFEAILKGYEKSAYKGPLIIAKLSDGIFFCY